MNSVVGRSKQRPAAKPATTVHQIVAYNFRRAREEEGWTQSQTSEFLEPFLGYRLNQAGVSAIEKTFDSERRRNIDVAEIVAFSRCFRTPISWFFLPPPGTGAGGSPSPFVPSRERRTDRRGSGGISNASAHRKRRFLFAINIQATRRGRVSAGFPGARSCP